MRRRRVQLAALAVALVAGALAASVVAGSAGAQGVCIPPLCTTTTTQAPPTTATTAPAPPPPPSAPSGPTGGAVTDRIDAARTGYLPGDTLVPPLVPLWSRRLPFALGQPIVAGGQVFVPTYQDGTIPAPKVWLQALDEATGRIRWKSKDAATAGLAYDGGLLVAGGFDALSGNGLSGIDAVSGRTRWTAAGLGSNPTLAGGTVYDSDSSGDDVAADAATGKILWHHYGEGSDGGFAVDGDSVYVEGPCEGAYRVDRVTGAGRWQQPGPCHGGGGFPSAVAGGRVALEGQQGITLRDTADGHITGRVLGAALPVLDGRRVMTAVGETDVRLTAADLATGRMLWRRSFHRGAVDAYAPIQLLGSGPWLYSMIGTQLQARSAGSGWTRWSTSFGPAVGTYGGPPEHIAMGPHVLIVVIDRQITAYVSLFSPGAHAVQALPERDAVFGRSVRVYGRTGVGLKRVRVRIVHGRRSLGSTRAAGDGFFVRPVRVARNTSLRAVAGKTHSRRFTIYVYPETRLHIGPAGTTWGVATARFRGPASIRLSGREVVAYLDRVAHHRLDRLGSTTLIGAGAGRATGRVTFRIPRRVGGNDLIAVCIPHQARIGLGDPRDPLVRRCGRSHIHY